MFKTLNLILKPLETIRYSIDICFLHTLISNWFGGSEIKVSACNAGDLSSIPRSGRYPGEGNGNPLQYSCLENPMDGGAWWATVHEVAKSQARLSDFTFTFIICIQSNVLSEWNKAFL